MNYARAYGRSLRRYGREPVAGETAKALHAAMHAAPGDSLPHLVYADYLDENDKPALAETIRRHFEAASDVPEMRVGSGKGYPPPGGSDLRGRPFAVGGKDKFALFVTHRSLADPEKVFLYGNYVPPADAPRLVRGFRGEGASVDDDLARFFPADAG